jgi:hypothetical protein
MMNYILNERPSPYGELNSYIKYIFSQFIFIGKRISRSKSLSDAEVVYLIEKIRHLYDLYFFQYYNALFSQLFDNEEITNFKKAFAEVDSVMKELDKLHGFKKDILRKAK